LRTLPEELVHVGSVRKCIEEAIRRERERACGNCQDRGYCDVPSISVYGGSIRSACGECVIGARYALDGMTEQRDRALAQVVAGEEAVRREVERRKPKGVLLFQLPDGIIPAFSEAARAFMTQLDAVGASVDDARGILAALLVRLWRAEGLDRHQLHVAIDHVWDRARESDKSG
jgi:hypothetical protein